MMTLLLYKCPEETNTVEIQVHNEDHNILGAQHINKETLLQKIAHNEPVVIQLLGWDAVEKKLKSRISRKSE